MQLCLPGKVDIKSEQMCPLSFPLFTESSPKAGIAQPAGDSLIVLMAHIAGTE